MDVKILEVSENRLVNAKIVNDSSLALPSMHQSWRFNFDKLAKRTPNSTVCVLVSEETPDIIEGCMIFQMKDRTIPYMAYVEVAPHNREVPRKYDYVAGCLIAFAFKQSLIHGKGDYKGWLAFDVCEETEEDQNKLMNMYRTKYNAVKFDDTTMLIMDEAGHSLIEHYLDRKAESQ